MATYQPIVTGYKPEGALGALYAGENAAMARQQTESANLADLFDAYQKQAQIQQAQFNLGEAKYKAPNERAVSDLAGATALGQNTPEYLTAVRGGQLGQAQSLAATGSRDTALLPSSIEAGKAENNSKVASAGFTEAAKQVDIIAGLAKQSPLMAASYISENIIAPDKRGEYLRLLRAGQIPALQKQFALENQAHIAEMDKERYKGGIELQKANISAAGYKYTADKNYDAAVAAANKLDLQSAEAAAKAANDAYKSSYTELKAQLDQFLPKDKQSPNYIALEQQVNGLRSKMVETADFIRTLRNKPKEPLATGKNVGQVSPAPATQPTVTPKVIDFGSMK